MEAVAEAAVLQPADRDKCEAARRDCEAACNRCFGADPGVRIELFGSVQTGLATRGAYDADLCMLTAQAVDGLHVLQTLAAFLGTMRDGLRCWSHVAVIRSARRPVLRCVHMPTGLQCDVTVNNRDALRNTAMIACYARADRRLGVLVHVLKRWLAGLVGVRHVSRYALTLLIIGFLQLTSPPVLPNLQAGRDAGEFAQAPEPGSMQTHNEEPVAGLLCGFLRFLADTDWAHVACCIRLGRPVVRDALAQECPPLRLGVLCIQDPFELSHNVAQSVGAAEVMRLRTNARAALARLHAGRYEQLDALWAVSAAGPLADGR